MNLWTPSEPRRMPQMPAGILLDARGTGAQGGGVMVGGTVAETGGGFRSAVNSGSEPSGFQSWAPSGCTSVWAFARFSVIQPRSCSALTGPYCWPSFPMILYMFSILMAVLTEIPAKVTQGSHRSVSNCARGICITAPSARTTLTVRLECVCGFRSPGPPEPFQPASLSKSITVCGLISLCFLPSSFALNAYPQRWPGSAGHSKTDRKGVGEGKSVDLG